MPSIITTRQYVGGRLVETFWRVAPNGQRTRVNPKSGLFGRTWDSATTADEPVAIPEDQLPAGKAEKQTKKVVDRSALDDAIREKQAPASPKPRKTPAAGKKRKQLEDLEDERPAKRSRLILL